MLKLSIMNHVTLVTGGSDLARNITPYVSRCPMVSTNFRGIVETDATWGSLDEVVNNGDIGCPRRDWHMT
jgi:hypothetical protein